jgi:uncharacterized damage-inducible protein DinB
MNTAAFRNLYEYHFTTNRTIWERCIEPLPQEKFAQTWKY